MPVRLMTWPRPGVYKDATNPLRYHMYTILQATFQGLERSGWEVVAYATNKQQAQDMTADLCGAAGVIPTLCIDTYGSMVAYES